MKAKTNILRVTEINSLPMADVLNAYSCNFTVAAILQGTAYVCGAGYTVYDRLTGSEVSRNRPDLLGLANREEATALLNRLYSEGYNAANVRRMDKKN